MSENPNTAMLGLPVAGYRAQGAGAVAKVNKNKQAEECVLRILDDLAADPETDKRWLAIGRTAIEQGFMAVNRAIFKPARLENIETEIAE